jgi:hypothetical protein
VGGGDLEAEGRPAVQQPAHDGNEQGLAQVIAHRDTQRRHRPARHFRQASEDRLRLLVEVEERGQRGLSRRGQADAAPGALEQLDAEVRLDAADLLADRGGRAMVQARGGSYGSTSRHREEAQERGEEAGVDHLGEITRRVRIFHCT